MMVAFQLISFLIIILVLYFVIRMLKGGINSSNGKVFRGSRLKLLLGTYLSVLLLSVVVFLFTPFEEVADGVDQRTNSEKSLTNTYQRFYDALYAGTLEDQRDVSIGDTYHFEYQGDVLHLSANFQDINVNILVEHKETNDGTIEVVNYLQHASIDGFEVSEGLPSVGAELIGDNTLRMLEPKHTEFRFNLFKKEFTINQFRSRSNFNDPRPFLLFSGQNAVLLRVPKDLEIKNDLSNVDLIIVETGD